MSNLVEHAKRELEACGQFKEDPAFAVSMLAAVSAFAAYPGHSGGSAMAGIEMLRDLLQFKALSPLTNDPDEWFDHGMQGNVRVWQNKRQGSCFSEDGGKTYYDVDDPKDGSGELPRYTSVVVHRPETRRVPNGSGFDEVPVNPEGMPF